MKVPLSMVSSMITNGVVGFVFIIVVLYCIGDLERVTLTSTGFPIIEIFYQSTNSVPWATGLTCMIVLLAMICQFGVYASVSRLVWAFAKDNGLPFAPFFARVCVNHQVFLSALTFVLLGPSGTEGSCQLTNSHNGNLHAHRAYQYRQHIRFLCNNLARQPCTLQLLSSARLLLPLAEIKGP